MDYSDEYSFDAVQSEMISINARVLTSTISRIQEYGIKTIKVSQLDSCTRIPSNLIEKGRNLNITLMRSSQITSSVPKKNKSQ